MLFAAPMASAALPPTWEEPSGGYQVIYDAAVEAWPHNVSPYWDIDPFRGDQYTSETSYVRTDDITGELALLMSESDPDGWPSYSLNHSGGEGMPDDKMTVDFRFRLLRPEGLPAEDRNHSSFRFNVWRPAPDWESSVRFAITFSETEIAYVNGTTAPYPFGTDWHDVRLTIDVEESIISVYIDGGTEPVYVEQGTPNQKAERNWILFGQQGGSVYGDVHLAYLKWTNHEINMEPTVATGGPALEIQPAVVLNLPTQEGETYEVTQTDASGITHWEHDTFIGDGDAWREVVSQADAANFSATMMGIGEWPEPEGGFSISYSASEWDVPYLSTPTWGFEPFNEYPDTHAYIVTDELTDEPALHLNGYKAGGNSPVFSLSDSESGGAGTISDKMTIDFRFRLVGERTGTSGQFRVGVWRPDSEADTSIRYMVDFLQDKISFSGGASMAYPVGTEWHEVRMTIDLVEKVARLYMDGSSAPLLEFPGGSTGQKGSRNVVSFGHAASSATGEARVAYFRFTNDDVAYPEPSWVPVEIEQENSGVELTGHVNLGSENRWEASGDLSDWAADGQFFGTHSPVVRFLDLGSASDRQFYRLVEEGEVSESGD